jgi:hypothetical protein
MVWVTATLLAGRVALSRSRCPHQLGGWGRVAIRAATDRLVRGRATGAHVAQALVAESVYGWNRRR